MPCMVKTTQIEVATQGNCHIVDITDGVRDALDRLGPVDSGTVVLFHVGSTGALTTIEYEPGLVKHDINAALERVAPAAGHYEHEKTWHDDNGHSHVRASLLGPSLTVPVVNGQLALGTWQQIVLIDFDTRPRRRSIVCQVIT